MLHAVFSGLSHEQNMEKMRLLTFMGMAVEMKEISFDTMQQELQIGAEDVESFVIDGTALLSLCRRFKLYILKVTVLSLHVMCVCGHLCIRLLCSDWDNTVYPKLNCMD